ncbi:hypothetical protein KKF91_18640 [Myxococcota bacterium]|nr:hypothetical protein [Myxococcota bacterium]
MQVNTAKLMKLYRFAEHHAMTLVRAIREHMQKNDIQDEELSTLVTQIEDQAQDMRESTEQREVEAETSPDIRPLLYEVNRACIVVRDTLQSVVTAAPPGAPRADAAAALLKQHFRGEHLRLGNAEVRRAFAWSLLKGMQQDPEPWSLADVAWTLPRLAAAHDALQAALQPKAIYASQLESRAALNERVSHLASYLVWRGASPSAPSYLGDVSEIILTVNAQIKLAR